MELELDMSWNSKIIQKRKEVYNLRNRECQRNFLEYINNCDILTKSLVQKDVQTGGRLWIKNIKYIIMQTFRKVRLTYKDKEICLKTGLQVVILTTQILTRSFPSLSLREIGSYLLNKLVICQI